MSHTGSIRQPIDAETLERVRTAMGGELVSRLEIARRTGLDYSLVCRSVRNLEEAGRVERVSGCRWKATGGEWVWRANAGKEGGAE